MQTTNSADFLNEWEVLRTPAEVNEMNSLRNRVKTLEKELRLANFEKNRWEAEATKRMTSNIFKKVKATMPGLVAVDETMYLETEEKSEGKSDAQESYVKGNESISSSEQNTRSTTQQLVNTSFFGFWRK